MKINIKIFLLGFSIYFYVPNSNAQLNEYSDLNNQLINLYLAGPIKGNVCQNLLKFPEKYNKRKVKFDSRFIPFINLINSNKLTRIGDIHFFVRKIGKSALIIDQEKNGIINSEQILLKGKYLRVNIYVSYIDSVLIRSKSMISTSSHGICGDYSTLLDYNYIKNFFISYFAFRLTPGFDFLTADTIYSENLKLLAERQNEYQFNIPGSNTEKWINDIFEKQYQSDSSEVYKYHSPPESFQKLIREGKLKEIKSLLFSPNYIISVNAMEAILYLAHIKKVELTPEIVNKINQIKEAPFIILQLGAPDVFYKRRGYKELNMTDEMIIRKYSLSM